MEERWLPVVGFEGHYEVSDMGRVRSLGKMGRDSYILKQLIHTKGLGHMQVCLSKEGKCTRHSVHRLVLLAFKGLPPPGCIGTHDNGIANDNRESNLFWKTYRDNTADQRRHGTLNFGEKAHFSRLISEDVMRIRDLHQCGAKSPAIAKWFDVDHSHVRRILTRKVWTHI